MQPSDTLFCVYLGTLGNITLRRGLLTACYRMNGELGIQKQDLAASGLGKAVMMLYNRKDETREMKELEHKCIEQVRRAPKFRDVTRT